MDSTLLKGLSVLEALAASSEPRGVSDLARELGRPKSNIHRTLQSLQAAGYVTAGAGGVYACSLKLFELGNAIADRVDVRTLAQPAMERLAAQTRETVHLALLDGWEVIYLHKIESSEPVRAYSRVGGRAPAHCVASGKALLAYQPASLLAELPPVLDSYTEATTTEADAVRGELETVRQQGYAVNRGEWRAEVGGLAAVVLGPGGVPAAALGVSGPLSRIEPGTDDHIAAVRTAARDASIAMGCSRYDQLISTWEGD
ncbi:IclR family transcriptional regulator [Streptomyces sp. TP-A0874]|uniref:IclR family transcriptional regulator n=1 Tax=Streptomyces sp. TP-A0874 TaxID=549819 RepID=UPI0008534C80|nr:IclR family transcriptional regulator [Streptomyces sp. TP-A0874]